MDHKKAGYLRHTLCGLSLICASSGSNNKPVFYTNLLISGCLVYIYSILTAKMGPGGKVGKPVQKVHRSK